MEESISVVIPVRNREVLIGESLESVIRQERQPAEIVVVDDGSRDATAEVVLEFSRRSPVPVRLFANHRTPGVSGATNSGIELARGSHIAFLDSDDLYCPAHLRQLSDALRRYPRAAIAFSGASYFGDASDTERVAERSARSVTNLLNDAFERVGYGVWLSDRRLLAALLRRGFAFRCPASLVRRDFLFRHGLFFNEHIDFTQESQLMIMAAWYTPFIHVRRPGLLVRRHAENDGDRKYLPRLPENNMRRVEGLRAFFRSKRLNADESAALAGCLFDLQYDAAQARTEGRGVLAAMQAGAGLLRRSPCWASVKTLVKLTAQEMGLGARPAAVPGGTGA
jgi:glycosyltransferase involved in cell wall biosynthesis